MPQQGGANAPYTRFRGPVLVGQSSDFGIAAVNGSSTAPLISFWNASEFGFSVASSSQVRFSAAGGSIWAYTSQQTRLMSSAQNVSIASTEAGRLTSTSVLGHFIIPVSTATLSSGSIPTNLNGGAAIVFMISSAGSTAGLGKLWLCTSDVGWQATTGLFTSTST